MLNIVSLTARLKEDPREVYVSSDATALRCMIQIDSVGNKAPTVIEMNLYGKTADRFSAKKGSLIYIYKARLRFDLENRSFYLTGGSVANVTDEFPIFNSVVLAGRCVKDIDAADPRQFKTTANGLIICNQTLAVSNGKNQSDLYNFYAINNADDKTNYAQWMCDYTKKGTGATIEAKLVTDSWTDKSTNEFKTQSKLQLVQMTLAPKAEGYQKPDKPAYTARQQAEPEVQQETQASNDAYSGSLPTLSNRFSGTPDLEDAPF